MDGRDGVVGITTRSGVCLSLQVCADKHLSATTLNSILAQNFRTEFKEGFSKTIRYIEAMPRQLKCSRIKMLIRPLTMAREDPI
jgi:hypothetical protein